MELSWLRNSEIRKAGDTCAIPEPWICQAQPADSHLPVGGSGDTGTLKERAPRTVLAESLSQELW